MNKKMNKIDIKNINESIKDKGDQKIIAKAIKELDTKDCLPARDRGDSKLCLLKTYPKLTGNTTYPKRVKVHNQKRKSNNITISTELDVKNIKTTKAIENCGDVRKEQNAKITKIVEKTNTEISKGTSTVPDNVREIELDEVQNTKDSDVFLLVNNKSHDSKKLHEKVKAKVPWKYKASDKNVPTNKYLDPDERKRLREKYTFKKLYTNNNENYRKCLFNNFNKYPDHETEDKARSSDSNTTNAGRPDAMKSNQQEALKPAKRTKETPPVHKKPIIKTIKFNNDNRVYKAVTFVEEKECTPLHIQIPMNYKRTKQYTDLKSIATNTVKSKIIAMASKVSVNTKSKKGRNRTLKKRTSSPVLSMSNDALPTEVAKWAPSCITGHTKPYYDAWVDTTLAAITKCAKNDKLYMEKQNLLQTFKRSLVRRPSSPELVYEDYKDERFTGRITVRRNKVKSNL